MSNIERQRERLTTVIHGRNLQRSLGPLSSGRMRNERRRMDELLDLERQKFMQMRLTTEELPEEITVNPALTAFLDGPDGLGGYADVYANAEYQEPGTRLQMEIERQVMKDFLEYTITPNNLSELGRQKKDLIIVEGGAGPDLRTCSVVNAVLSDIYDNVNYYHNSLRYGDTKVKLLIADISTRMAALTASKIKTSNVVDWRMDIETAVLAADVFELLNGLPDQSLTAVLLPFGVLSFGLDGKDPSQILKMVAQKLRLRGGMFITVYNSNWQQYVNQLEQVVSRTKLPLSRLNPFVIRIRDGYLQVAEGEPFSCRTFMLDELAEIVEGAGLQINEAINTPQGWAYWPDELLKKVVEGKTYPKGCPQIPPPYLMDLAKQHVLDLARRARGKKSTIAELASIMPNGNEIEKFPAPYITITARKL